MSSVDPRLARSLPPASAVEDPSPTRVVGSTSKIPQTEPLPISPSRRLAAKFALSLRRRWLLAILFGLLGSWLAGVVILSQVPLQHRAEVWLYIQHTARETPTEVDQDGGFLRAQELLLKSPLVLEAALRRPELEELLKQRSPVRPVDWLDQRISIETIPGQVIVRVIATSPQPDEPPLLAHAVAQAYVQEKEAKVEKYLAQLKAAYQHAQDQLRTQQAALTAAEDPRLAQLETERQHLQRERKLLQAEVAVLQTKEKTVVAPTDAEINEAIKADAEIRDCQKEIDRLNEQIKAYERISVLGKNDPAVSRLSLQRSGWNDKFAERREQVIATIQQVKVVKTRAELQKQREALEAKLSSLDELEKKLAADGKTLASTDAGGSKGQTLREDVAANQEAVRRFAAEIQTQEAAAQAGPCVSQLGEARRFPEANRRQRLWSAGLGASLTFVLLTLFIGWIDSSDRRVQSASDVGLALNLPILGTLPDLKTPPATSDTASGPEAEAVDVLRTLLLRRTGGGPCVLLVTSAVSGEGKTTLASHLAASLARAWRKTLLIDGDLRKPTAHKRFNVALDPGLSDALRGDVEAADVIHQTALSRLWLLPAGHSDNHALQALSQPEGAAFLNGLREQYEFIVVDSAPVLAIADTLLLSQRADAVVLAVRCGTSRLPSVRAAQQRLDAMSAPFLGAVVLGGRGDPSGTETRYP